MFDERTRRNDHIERDGTEVLVVGFDSREQLVAYFGCFVLFVLQRKFEIAQRIH